MIEAPRRIVRARGILPRDFLLALSLVKNVTQHAIRKRYANTATERLVTRDRTPPTRPPSSRTGSSMAIHVCLHIGERDRSRKISLSLSFSLHDCPFSLPSSRALLPGTNVHTRHEANDSFSFSLFLSLSSRTSSHLPRRVLFACARATLRSVARGTLVKQRDCELQEGCSYCHTLRATSEEKKRPSPRLVIMR